MDNNSEQQDKNVDFCINSSHSRTELWKNIFSEFKISHAAEIGVWKGEFAQYLLRNCEDIQRYYMIDPWKKLDQWNKPWNIEDDYFQAVYQEAVKRTKFAEEKIKILRGTTRSVIDQIESESLDLVYIDGDHTLRGISIDLISSYSRVRPGGFIGGDDLSSDIWQHSPEFEPTLVFPFALYFAEACNAKIYLLPFNQFLIQKPASSKHSFSMINFTDLYNNTDLLPQLSQKDTARSIAGGYLPSSVIRLLKRFF